MKIFGYLFFFASFVLTSRGYSQTPTSAFICTTVTNQTDAVMYMKQYSDGSVNRVDQAGSLSACAYRDSSNPEVYYAFSNTEQTTWSDYASFECEVTHDEYGYIYIQTYTITGSSDNWSIDGGVCTSEDQRS